MIALYVLKLNTDSPPKSEVSDFWITKLFYCHIMPQIVNRMEDDLNEGPPSMENPFNRREPLIEDYLQQNISFQ